MSYLVLARKYRPQTFDQVVGQDHVTQTLKNAIRSDRVAHALLFAGPRGVGKTSVARIMAKAVNCVQGPTPSPCNVCPSCKEITDGFALDVFEIDGASNRGIDEIRELRENIKYMPSRSRFKIYIIDEVHMLTAPAFNALLKTLEEPPAHVLFFFATTEPHKIPITILSRCQRHNFKRIAMEPIMDHLEQVSQKSSFGISRESLRLLARKAAGSMRDALSLLDQVMAYAQDTVSDEDVLEALGTVEPKVLSELFGALLDGNVVSALNKLDDLYNQGYDLKRLYGQMLEYARHLLMVKLDEEQHGLVQMSAHEISLLKARSDNLSLESAHQIFTIFFEAEATIRYSGQPKIALEALFVKLLQLPRIISLDQIITRIDRVANSLKISVSKPGAIPVPPEHKEAAGPPGHQAEALATEPTQLAQTWKQLIGLFAEQCKFLGPSLEKARLGKIEQNSLEIVVSGSAFDVARLQDEKNVAKMQDLCSHFFGRKMKIMISQQQGENNGNGTSVTDKTRQLRKEALSHPIVTDALEVFHGTVVDVKIL